MSIVLTRIDNRLIHGQVLEAWVPFLQADCIVVANDEVADIPFRKMLMEAAVPRGIDVVIANVRDTAKIFSERNQQARRVLLLFENSSDALNAHKLGVPFQELNLGNMHGGTGKVRYSCTIALDPDDVQNLASLENEGVRIVSQCIPSDRERNWRKLLGSSEG